MAVIVELHADNPVSDTNTALTLQMLEWISSRPRTYADVMDAWRTSCPRLSIWEDACIDGLIDRSGGIVTLTPKGTHCLRTAHEDHDS